MPKKCNKNTKKTIEIRRDKDDWGNYLFDTYEQLKGDSEYLATFESEEEATNWIKTTFADFKVDIVKSY